MLTKKNHLSKGSIYLLYVQEVIDPFYIISYYTKWVQTYWTYGNLDFCVLYAGGGIFSLQKLPQGEIIHSPWLRNVYNKLQKIPLSNARFVSLGPKRIHFTTQLTKSNFFPPCRKSHWSRRRARILMQSYWLNNFNGQNQMLPLAVRPVGLKREFPFFDLVILYCNIGKVKTSQSCIKKNLT